MMVRIDYVCGGMSFSNAENLKEALEIAGESLIHPEIVGVSFVENGLNVVTFTPQR